MKQNCPSDTALRSWEKDGSSAVRDGVSKKAGHVVLGTQLSQQPSLISESREKNGAVHLLAVGIGVV